MKLLILLLTLALSGCAAVSNPFTGESSRPPGTFTVNIAPTGCGAIVDSNTLRGGPSVIVTRTADGDCTIDVRHNLTITELEPLLNILGGI